MNRKYLILFLILGVSLNLIGCDRVFNEAMTVKNKWSLGERADKISGAKTIVASARLNDDAQPEKYVDTEISCADGKNANMQFVLHTSGDANEKQSAITSNENFSLLRMRSGDLQFVKAGSVDFTNQVEVSFSGVDGIVGLGFAMLGASVKSLEKELVSPELYVEIPSKYGSPVVLIKLEDSSIQAVLKNCGIVPAYQVSIHPNNNFPQQEFDKCVGLKIAAYRKENGKDAVVKTDMQNEWTEQCKAGR